MTINDYFIELGVRCGRYEFFRFYGKTQTATHGCKQYALILQHKRKAFAYIGGVKYDFATGCRLDQPHKFNKVGEFNRENLIIWHACYNDALSDCNRHLKIKPKT